MMGWCLCVVLGIICIGAFGRLVYDRRQLIQWLAFLREVKKAPGLHSFIKGRGVLAEIHFELNDILEENRRQFVKLQKVETANQQLLTDLSHDVRTPLASLTGYLEALESQKADDPAEYIHVAYKKALELQELIDMLFQWFRLTSDEQRYQIKCHDINELTREIVIDLLPVLEKSNVKLTADIPEEEWSVEIDRAAYGRILGNLISNAIKHGKCSSIEIRIQRGEDEVQVLAANDGAAIPESELPFIFDRLYKCDTARSESGTGLGLAIVRELTGAMSGHVSVESIPGGKTTFCLTFPTAR